jgi:hypothetical protein
MDSTLRDGHGNGNPRGREVLYRESGRRFYFNEARPHHGIGQLVPANRILGIDTLKQIVVTSVLGGLHADYRRAA